jgi:hypothetical protein
MYAINNNQYSVTHQRHNVRYKQQSILSNFTKDIMYVINNNQYSVTHQRHNVRYKQQSILSNSPKT